MRRILIALISYCALSPAFSGWFTSDGKSFEECMENRRSEIKTAAQMAIANGYCRSKHPAFHFDTPPEDPVIEYSFQATGGSGTARIAQLVNLIDINAMDVSHLGRDYGHGVKSRDFRHYLRIQAINRNEFGVSRLVVGVLKPTSKSCSWDAKSYVDIYVCAGGAGAGLSGTFQCHIPGIDKRRVTVCLLGFNVEGPESQMKKLLQTQGLSAN